MKERKRKHWESLKQTLLGGGVPCFGQASGKLKQLKALTEAVSKFFHEGGSLWHISPRVPYYLSQFHGGDHG